MKPANKLQSFIPVVRLTIFYNRDMNLIKDMQYKFFFPQINSCISYLNWKICHCALGIVGLAGKVIHLDSVSSDNSQLGLTTRQPVLDCEEVLIAGGGDQGEDGILDRSI